MASFKSATLKIRIEGGDEAEQFLRGLIVAQSNNSSPLFGELIEAVNFLLEDYKGQLLEEEMAARAKAGMP